jgi:hypothetical protein
MEKYPYCTGALYISNERALGLLNLKEINGGK